MTVVAERTTERRILTTGDRLVPWIHTLPHDWSHKPLKYVCKFNASVLDEMTDAAHPIRYIDISTVDSNGDIGQPAELDFGDAPSRARRVLSKGDVFISTVRTYLTAIGSCGDELDGCICSTGFAVFTPGTLVHPRFLLYWSRHSSFVSEIVARSTGVSYPAINASEIGNLPFPVIPTHQQQAIASFLDHKTAAIDTLIAKKQRMIELLQEKRQALISQAITKGLNTSVPMRDSKSEWLGTIPAHWQVTPLKRKWTVIDCKHLTVSFVDEGVPVASIREVRNGVLSLEQAKRTTRAEYMVLIEGRKPRRGDIIYSRNASVGEVGYVDTDEIFCMGQDVCLLTSLGRDQRYLAYQLRSPIVQNQLSSLLVGATFKRINVGDIKEFVVCCPPQEEQKAISMYCQDVDRRTESCVNQLTTQNARLRDYRQGVIAAAVTGRLDLREGNLC